MEVYPIILNSYRAQNNNEPTWTPNDKEWYMLKTYLSIWNVVEKFFMECFLIASEGDADMADEIGEEFMTWDVGECLFGYNFFEAIVANDGYADFIDFLDSVEVWSTTIELIFGGQQRLRNILL